MDVERHSAVKPTRLNRRRFLGLALAGAPALGAGHSVWLEPGWLRVRTIRLTDSPRDRFVHFTDVHFKGDRDYFERIVSRINSLSPNFACFTGDLIEEADHLPDALDILRGIRCPVYGVPGNHDHWSRADFAPIEEAFAATGGAWLMDRQITIRSGRITLTGAAGDGTEPPRFSTHPGALNILLMHFPLWVEKLRGQTFDLILAGHSHGGQVRLPLVGALMVPYNVGKSDLGMFQTEAGPLYVNPGTGWFLIKARLLCRPELTVFEI